MEDGRVSLFESRYSRGMRFTLLCNLLCNLLMKISVLHPLREKIRQGEKKEKQLVDEDLCVFPLRARTDHRNKYKNNTRCNLLCNLLVKIRVLHPLRENRYSQGRKEGEAVRLLEEMVAKGLQPERKTLSSMIVAHSWGSVEDMRR